LSSSLVKALTNLGLTGAKTVIASGVKHNLLRSQWRTKIKKAGKIDPKPKP